MKQIFSGALLGSIITVCSLILCMCGSITFMFTSIASSVQNFNTTALNMTPDENISKFVFIDGEKTAQDKILSLKFDGIILTVDESNGVGSIFGTETTLYGENADKLFSDIAKDTSIKGVVIEINSPGGTVIGSKMFGKAILDYKKATGNPVFAYVPQMAASGGYWIAVSADKIFVEDGASVGSVGVIMGPLARYKDILSTGNILSYTETKSGINMEYFTAGKYKDMGNPFRDMLPEERKHIQDDLDMTYQDFVSYIVSNRKNLNRDKLVNEYGAHMWTGQKAINNGYADVISDRKNVYTELAKQKKLSNYQIVGINPIQNNPFAKLFGLSVTTLLDKNNTNISKYTSICDTKQSLIIDISAMNICESRK